MALLISGVGAQGSCVGEAQFEQFKARLLADYEQYKAYQRQFVETLRQQTVALKAVQVCQRDDSQLNDLVNRLTLQPSACRREITEYNNLEATGDRLKEVIGAYEGMLRSGAEDLKALAKTVCLSNQPGK